MSNNCLVKKYKADVNDNNLPFYGKFKIYFKSVTSPSDKSQGLRTVVQNVPIGSTYEMELLGDVHFTDSTLAQNTGTILNNRNSDFYVSNGNGVLLIPEESHQISAVAGAGDYYKAYYIKLDEYADSESFINIAVRKSDTEGSILNLVKNINLTSLNVMECPNVTGELIDFITSQIDNYGRTSGQLDFYSAPSGVTLEHEVILGNITINYVSASQFTYTYQTVTTTYNKVNGVWTKQV